MTVTNPFKSEPVNPNVSDAAVWEQRYGEPGSWVGGVWVGFNDLTDAGARYIDKAGKAVTNWIGSGYRRAAAQLSGGKKSKPKQKDTFSDPFPVGVVMACRACARRRAKLRNFFKRFKKGTQNGRTKFNYK